MQQQNDTLVETPLLDGESSLKALASIYARAQVLNHQGTFITVNGFTDQTEPLNPSLLTGLAQLALNRLNGLCFDVVLGEDDKGAPIATAVSILAQVPLILARWYVYDIESVHADAVIVNINSEYFAGRLIVNGIKPGMRILIVDDTLSTGGTLVALIEACRRRGADVVAALAIVEKTESNGAQRVFKNTGIRPWTLLRVRTTESRVCVLGPSLEGPTTCD